MTVGVQWAIAAAAAAVSLAPLVAYSLAQAAAAADTRLAHLEDAPDLVDDLVAIAESSEKLNQSVQARPEVKARSDFELWRRECGWVT